MINDQRSMIIDHWTLINPCRHSGIAANAYTKGPTKKYPYRYRSAADCDTIPFTSSLGCLVTTESIWLRGKPTRHESQSRVTSVGMPVIESSSTVTPYKRQCLPCVQTSTGCVTAISVHSSTCMRPPMQAPRRSKRLSSEYLIPGIAGFGRESCQEKAGPSPLRGSGPALSAAKG